MFYLKIIGILIAIIAIVIIYLWVNYSPSTIIRYISKHPSSGSIYVVKNESILIDKNSDNLMPLASTVKIIIAIEFARQAAAKRIDSNEHVKLSELDKYLIKNTDGGAHAAWLKHINNSELIKNNSVTIAEIARGMIQFSSNANSEYLMDKLGFDNVNKVIADLDLKQHEQLYPFVSCLLVLRDHTFKELKNMSKGEYIKLSYDVHDKLREEKINKTIVKKEITTEKLKLFSELLTRGTAREYGYILSRLNSRDYFSPEEYEYVDNVLKTAFTSPNIAHDGEKGGSTSYILNMSYYETTKSGDTTEFVIFLNNLSPFQNMLYSISLFKIKLDLISGSNIEKYNEILQLN